MLLTAPLALIGVAAALLCRGAPMGFVAILGIISLIGMVIRNSVILIDQIDQQHRRGRGSVEGGHQCHRASPAADPADGRGRHPRHDPDRADGVLGTDGLRRDGRTGGRDAADAGVPAGALRDLVQNCARPEGNESGAREFGGSRLTPLPTTRAWWAMRRFMTVVGSCRRTIDGEFGSIASQAQGLRSR